MSQSPTRPTPNHSLIQQTLKQCGCKAVFLTFSCGHDFVRISLCNGTIDLDEQSRHPRRKVVLRSRRECAECVLIMRLAQNELAALDAVGKLSERGSPSKFWVDRRSQISAFEQRCHLDTANFVSHNDTYQLPALTYNPHAPENVAEPSNPCQSFAQRSDVIDWIHETNDFPNIETSTSDLLFDWLRSEIVPSSEDDDNEGRPIDPISPLRYLGDTFDTSAASCARTSGSTVRRHKIGIAEYSGSVDWVGSLQDEGGDIVDAIEKTDLPNSSKENQVPQLIDTKLHFRPSLPVVHITKSGPPPSMFNKARSPEKSLLKVLKSSINRCYRSISTKFFTKRGIDGRVLQRRSLVTLRSGRLFSSNRMETRAEEKVEAPWRKVPKRRYAERGDYEVVFSTTAWSDRDGDEDDSSEIVERGKNVRTNMMTTEGLKSWVTCTS